MFPYIAFILTIAGLTAVNLLKDRAIRRRLQPLRVPVKAEKNPKHHTNRR